MPLNYDFSKVKDHEKLHEDDNEWRTTDTLIWMCMAVSMNKITKENYKEFYARVHMIEKLNGAMRHANQKPVFFTLEEVKKRIGLSTNASNLTRAQFIKVKAGRFIEEAMNGTA